ncbi:MAG TPA: tRNA (adenosine(37)-N6)-dimethylallyltransferase MiaA [Patescibacteria group bacterium]|nr:tRNA (adenosine(37)-N6)-dimethylallyltransferase MiaA [Patescibacteria group bacterium]
MGKTITKLLVICGPTATGKTKFASYLASKYNGVLISADSRMVYKYMNIGTGKDIEKYGEILGYDLVCPDEEFSVSDYVKFADNEVKKIKNQKKLPIIVGGTGFYIKAVVDNLDRVHVPKNLELRKKLENLTADDLYALIMKIKPEEALKLNESDRKNARRLIRLLEVLEADKDLRKDIEKIKFDSVLWIGLKLDKNKLEVRIKQRVQERIKNGFEKEYEFLKKKDYLRYAPSRTIGYKDWPYVKRWEIEEIKYAKRQVTWFKKDERINWFDISDKNWQNKAEILIRNWYA